MGKQIITKCLEDCTYSCKYCKTFIFKYNNILKFEIETPTGIAFEIDNCENIILYQSYQQFLLNETTNITLFDDSPLLLMNKNHQSYFIHCILCNLLLGWKHKHKYIIKKDSMFYKSSLATSIVRMRNP